MYTVEDILQSLGREPPGQVLMINLLLTIDANLVNGARVRRVLDDYARVLGTDGLALPKNALLARRLGEFFVFDGIWEESAVPELRYYASGGEVTLSRVVCYESFYRMLNSSEMIVPRLPVARKPWASGGGEIADADVASVARYVNDQDWRRDMLGCAMSFKIPCAWLTACSLLDRRLRANERKLPDHYRDLMGLSHLRAGHHLIRFDFPLEHARPPRGCKCRQPHGAGNGGTRFRFMNPRTASGWGTTVDLRRVRRRDRAGIDGVPELLMGEFSPTLATARARYIGRVVRGPEREDAFFLGHLQGVTDGKLATTLLSKVMT